MKANKMGLTILLGTLLLQHVIEAGADKDGQCPSPPGGLRYLPKNCDYSDSCEQDFDCPKIQKCCPIYCSKKCMAHRPGRCVPNQEKINICLNNILLGILTKDECDDDSKCDEPKKCCLNGCRRTCEYPVDAHIIEKDGYCPAPPGGGIFIPQKCGLKDYCKMDSECDKKMKCCQSVCQKKCKDPATPKKGVCPFVSIDECTSFGHPACEFDSDCTGTQKCCALAGCKIGCSEPMTKMDKVGQCPPPPGGAHNFPKDCGENDGCKDDAGCTGNQKCCQTVCKKVCMTPAPPKPGMCPVVKIDKCSSFASQTCNSDANCDGSKKCCILEDCTVGCTNKASPAPKRGLCPGGPPRPYECQVEKPELDCESDTGCERTDKCCPSHCDMKCTRPASESRTGSCPVEEHVNPDNCEKVTGACFFDSDCGAGQKCCIFSCKRTCMKAQETKCGKCPTLPPNLQCPANKYVYNCYGDSDCDGKQKCCPYGCNKECRPAQEDIVVPP